MAYSKQTLVRGEKVASTKLNHMEDGIAAISANGAIGTAKLADGAVTLAKLADAVKSHFATADDVKNVNAKIENADNELYDFESITPYTTVGNWKLTNTGLCTNDDTCLLAKYNVLAGQVLKLKLSNDTTTTYQFQSNTSVPSTGTNPNLVGSPVDGAVDAFVEVPSGAKFLIVSQKKTNATNSVKIASSKTDILEAITETTKNINTAGQGRYYSNSSGSILAASANYIGMPDRIPVEADTDYAISFYNTGVPAGTIFVCWYDSSKALIGSRSSYVGPHTTIKSPANAAYLHADLYDSNGVSANATIQVERGTESTYYVPHETAVDDVARGEIQEIAGGDYPSYFDAQMQSALALIKANEETVGKNGDSFVFITDPHWDFNVKHSPDLIHHIANKTSVRNVICGGDALDSGSKAYEIAKGYDFMRRFKFVEGGLKFVIGNHDSNKNQHADSSYWLSCEQMYAIFHAPAKMEMHDFYMPSGVDNFPYSRYYFDVPATNTRYIVCGAAYGSITADEVTWITAQVTDNPSMNFVIIGHFLYDTSTLALSSAGQSIAAIADAHSNVKAIITGHIHADIETYTDGGVPVIATDTDAASRLGTLNPNTATIGTVTELAFDTITVDFSTKSVRTARIGRGLNRIVHGGVNNVTTTITLTSELTSPTWSTSDSSVATVNNGVVTKVASGSAIIKATTANSVEIWFVKS